jgi:hypothetical protein
LKGGEDKATISKALALLRADEQLAEMETLLAFFATFVITVEEVDRTVVAHPQTPFWLPAA